MREHRLLAASAMQVVALVAPFVYLRLVVRDHGANDALSSELVVTIVAFFSVALDWSSTTFLARVQSRLVSAGVHVIIGAARIVAGLVLLVFAATLIGAFKPNVAPGLVLALSFATLGLALDISWVHVGRGRLWTPAAIAGGRSVMAIALTVAGLQPVTALGIAYFVVSLLFLAPILFTEPFPRRVSWRLIGRIIRRYRLPTSTELLTSTFSRLDVPAAAALLSVEQALLYAVCRKLSLGMQSVAFAGVRMFYLERDKTQLERLRSGLLRLSSLVVLTGVPASYVAATYLMGSAQVNPLLTISILALLIPLGYLKNLVQFGKLFRGGRFHSDLLCTLGSTLVFALSSLALAVSSIDSAAAVALGRVTADAAYLAAYHFIKQ